MYVMSGKIVESEYWRSRRQNQSPQEFDDARLTLRRANLIDESPGANFSRESISRSMRKIRWPAILAGNDLAARTYVDENLNYI